MIMNNLAGYINAIKNGKNVICIEEVWSKDELAEIEIVYMSWLHDSGVVISYSCENEIVQHSLDSCPECCIKWRVVDAADQDISPMEKTFRNVCQESYWLKMNS